mgnify:FL=1
MKKEGSSAWLMFGTSVASWAIGLWLFSGIESGRKAIFWPAIVFAAATVILLVEVHLDGRKKAGLAQVLLNLNQKLSAKDLSIDKAKDFLSWVAGGLNKMIEAILGIRIFAGKVGIATEDVVESAKFSSNTMQSIATFASEIAQAAREISSLANDASLRVQTFSAGIQESSSTMENIAVQGKSVESEAEENVKLVQETTQGIKAVDEATKRVSEAIGQMQRVSRDIVEIVGSIKGIAAQTNLLALNAAIEAARAGEHGRGFAVVAEEVRSLAEESSKAASNIENLANSIRALAEEGVKSIDIAGKKVLEANEKAKLMGESNKKVMSIVEDLIREIELTSETFQTQAESSVEMANFIAGITEKVDHQTKRLDEMNSLLQDEAISSDAMAEKVEVILSSANAMEKSLFKFKLRADELSSSLIKDRGVMRIGIENRDWGRFHFWRGGKVQGIDVDLANEIAKALGVKAEFVPTTWGNGEKGTLSGTWLSEDWSEFDIVISAITKLPSRAEKVVFSVSYASVGQKILFRKQDGFNSLKDLAGKKVGAQKGTTSEAIARKNLTGSTIVPYASWQDALQALKKGEISAAVIDSPTVQSCLDEDPSLSSLRTVLTWEHFGVVLPKFVSGELKEIVDDVVMKNREQLANKWLKSTHNSSYLATL